MSIKIRLLISYIAMLLIPVVLTVIAAILIGIVYFGVFFNYYGVKLSSSDIRNSIESNNRAVAETIMNISAHPEKLNDSEFVSRTDRMLNYYDAGIIIRKGNNYVYKSKLPTGNQLIGQLGKVKWENNRFVTIKTGVAGSVHDLITKRAEIKNMASSAKIYAVTRYNFLYDKDKKGEAYFFVNINPLKQFVERYFKTLVTAILVILILTNGLLTFFVSRSIIKPLEYLKTAANEIKNGNLNYKLKYKSKDEIGELSSAFEEMRCKLKESIELEQQYEINRKELVSNISHDLKTPITAVKGYVEGIIDGVADTPEKMDKYIKTIYTKTNEIDKLIDELFLYSKLDLKKLPFNFEEIDVKRYLADCSEDLAFDMESKGISLSFTAEIPDGLKVIADREKLNRVIMNVVGNSEKYVNKNGGEININLYENDKMAVVSISDNGQGISEEDLPFIFEKFYRADPARNTARGGSGLGLAIAKHIIEEHGGKIWVESRIGVGTTISFTLKKT